MSVEIPGYKIIRAVGRGGMATVYLAEQEIFEREVALKIMSTSLSDDPSFGQRFFREAKIVSRLVHPNIVTVHDVGEHDGHYYLSMEHIDGGDLKLARKRLTFRQKITAVKDIAKALQYAATKGYVHRDIKPENIMFHMSDGRAVLTDFGIARAAETDASVTQTGVAIGTPHYMSPEQAKGQAVDHRADIYSLGVVLYLLIVGKVPYDAESAVAIGIKHITEPIPLLPVAMNLMQPVVDKMMAKAPDQRYQSAASVITALDNLEMLVLEKAALILDREARDLETTTDNESPTLVSAQISAISIPSQRVGTTVPGTPVPDSVRSGTSPRSRTPRPGTPHPGGTTTSTTTGGGFTGGTPTGGTLPPESLSSEPVLAETQINEDVPAHNISTGGADDEPERFTVIYENEIGDLDDVKPSLWRRLSISLLLVGVGAGTYLYFNPADWTRLVEKSFVLQRQASNAMSELIAGFSAESPSPASVDENNNANHDNANHDNKSAGLNEAKTTSANEAMAPVEEVPGPGAGSKSASSVTSGAANLTLDKTDEAQPGRETSLADAAEELNAAIDGDVVEPEAVTDNSADQRVEEQRAKIATLRDAYLNDSAFLADLVTSHRELLALVPDDEDTLANLTNIRESEINKISELANEKKFPTARKKLEQLGYLFPEIENTALKKIEGSIDSLEEIETILSRADKYFTKGEMISPEKENALAYYKLVLSKNAGNARAQAGTKKISNHYLSLATKAFSSNDIPAAEALVKTSLEVDWKNDKAVLLLENIRNLQENLAQQELLFLQAEKSLNEGHYFEPVKDNAYHFYALLLADDPENDRAISGIDMTIEGFSAWVWKLVGESKFDEAINAFIAPLNMLPKEERLLSLSAAVNEVIADHVVANRPDIVKLIVSDKELADVSGEQAESISVRAGRSVYVIFNYEHFSAGTSLVQVKLLDGAGNIEIAQTTVEISGSEGIAKYKIDSPVGSFPPGLYTLVSTLDSKTLNSTLFSVE